ncbi:hypothetical protein Q1695_014328 [Nippostrongylus brasiliensis]|nr:hypothetical protein Q1695_014328 [Nippostrongylus brasiliensis]
MSTEGDNIPETVEKASEDVQANKAVASQTDKSPSPPKENSRRSGPRHTSHYEPNLNSLYRCSDFTRPLASKEDTVVYFKRGEVGLAHVHKVDRKKLDANLYNGLISCQTLELETIPSCRRIRRLVEEVLVVDRGFSIGETVIKYENENIGDADKEHMCIPRSDAVIGQVVNVEVRGDVVVLPSKNLIVKNVALGNNEYTEMVNYNSAHNYIMYKDWIGNASDCINDVTLLYRGRHRFVVKEGGRSGVFLCRQDRSDDSKALVPGERVSIAIGDALGERRKPFLGRSAVWEQKPPRTLTCSRRRRATEGIKCVIEKIETNSLLVEWIMSPSSSVKPPKIIPKSEVDKVARIDPSANPRPSTCDRIKVVPDDFSTVVTAKEYFSSLSAQYGNVFKKLVTKDAQSSQCENCSTQLRKDTKEDAPTAKAAKIARMSNSGSHQESESTTTSTHNAHENEVMASKEDDGTVAVWESSDESSAGEETPIKCVRSRVVVYRNAVRQKRMRKCPTRRRRCTPALPVESPRLAKDVIGSSFVGEVLTSHTLVDVQWMNGSVEEKIPGYLLIPHDPDLDQQDHLPGVIVARKEAQNTDTVFGLILSTNCAERSCVVSWFERTQTEVKCLGEEECLLFDIMAHPFYKRLFVGNYGVSINHTSFDMRDIAFQVVADLRNGKQRVRFLNGAEEELWPFDILPINFVDESLDSDSDDDDYSITEGEMSKDSAVSAAFVSEARTIINRYGVQISNVLREANGAEYVFAFFPDLKKKVDCKLLSSDPKTRTIQLFFAGVIQEVMPKDSGDFTEELLILAEVLTAVYRSNALPNNFDPDVLLDLVSDFEMQFPRVQNNVFIYFFQCDGYHINRIERSLFGNIPHAGFLDMAIDTKAHPEWLTVFHEITESVFEEETDPIRVPLRSSLHKLVDGSTFKPRYLSKAYVESVSEDIHVAVDVCSAPIVRIHVMASAQELAKGVQKSELISKLVKQILCLNNWPANTVDLFIMDASRPPKAITRVKTRGEIFDMIRAAFAEALVLLHRCGLLCYDTLSKDSLWSNLNVVFSRDYETPRLIEYATLHEIIMFVRSVDCHHPEMLSRLIDVTKVLSFDSVYSQVKEEYERKLSEIGDVGKGKIYLNFKVLDECPGKCDADHLQPSRKFFTAVFKEHKVLAEHVPDNIHVHAFANKLNSLHVLIIGPVGTPFDSTPFFFKFRLPYEYPQKPPEVTYVAYSQEQLNPNLYQNGKVCTSLLGTWSGQGVETWNPSKSNILQVLLSIQALILVPEPYFNEAGYESRKQQSEMSDRSRRYNETATINSLEYLLKIYKEPPSDFKDVVRKSVRKSWPGLRSRINGWISGESEPAFPTMGSKGFKMALEKAAAKLDAAISVGPNTEEAAYLEPMETNSTVVQAENAAGDSVFVSEDDEIMCDWVFTAELKPIL